VKEASKQEGAQPTREQQARKEKIFCFAGCCCSADDSQQRRRKDRVKRPTKTYPYENRRDRARTLRARENLKFVSLISARLFAAAHRNAFGARKATMTDTADGFVSRKLLLFLLCFVH